MVEKGDPAQRRGERLFVGRDREAAELVAGLEDAVEGRGRLFLIAGEPGIGKTALASYLADRAVERGARVLWGRFWEGGGAPPYWPWAQIVRTLAEDYDEETLRAYLGPGAAYIDQLAPAIAERLGKTPLPAYSLESDAARFSLFEATAGFLEQASSTQPLVLVFDDLHAADRPSLLLLQFLARDLRTSRLLTIGTYRPAQIEQPGDVMAELLREGWLITLQGLDRHDVGDVIEELSGVVPFDGKVQAIHDTTAGNPLFVREVVRLLAPYAALDRPGRLTVTIPDSVRAVIRQRLALLSTDTAQVLSAAAVAGREFRLSLVAPACDLPSDRVLGSLVQAVRLGVVAEVGFPGGNAEEAPTAGLYRFSHPLIREVIYEGRPIRARAQMHRRLGETIERLHGASLEPHLAELAHHFAHAVSEGEGRKALEYARRAGERAMQAHAYEDAAVDYRRALDALEAVGPDEVLRCDLLLRLGDARARAGDYPEARHSYGQAAELSRKLGAAEQLARAALGFAEPQVEGGPVNRQILALLQEALEVLSPQDSPLRARLLARLSLELTFSDEVTLRASLSREAVGIARRLADPVALASALRARWMAAWGPDGLDERAALAEEMLDLAGNVAGREIELMGRRARAASSLEAGDVLEAKADTAAYVRLADEMRMPFHTWTSRGMQAMWAALQGSFEEAERVAGEALSLQTERPNAFFAHLDLLSAIRWEQGRLGELRQAWQEVMERYPPLSIAMAWLSLADAELGREDDARRSLRSLVDGIADLPRDGRWLSVAAAASLAAAWLNEPGHAGRLYPLLLPYAKHIVTVTTPHPIACLGAASFYLGLLASVMSRWEEADDHFEEAMGAHDRLGARPLLARTQYEYARMLIRRGRAQDRSQALGLLDRALGTARLTGMARVAEEIGMLKELAGGGTVATHPARQMFRREGEYWTVAYDGSVVRLGDSKGLGYLARLLAHPGREFLAIDLEAHATAAESTARTGVADLEVRADLGDAGELLDAEAKAAYKARLEELQAEMDEAARFYDAARAAKASQERDFLVRELTRAVGLGGRDRRAASHAERARLNVTRAIRAATARLARANPSLGHHLSSTIRTGRYCSYTPDPRSPIDWDL